MINSQTHLRSLLLCLCAVSLLALSGCGGCGEPIGDDLMDAGGDGGGACVVLGQTCAQNGDCCSGSCDPSSLTCANAVTCGKFDDACALSSDCCSGLCDQAAHKCSVACGGFDQTCSMNADCCSGVCDPVKKSCTQPISCKPTGATCALGTDCCGLSCVGGLCQAACTSDGQTCAAAGQCCSGICSGTPATCGVLNPGAGCKSSGNGCGANGDCCSGLCAGTPKTCSTASSFCRQNSDVCAKNSDCCSTTCVITAPNALGTCQAVATSGAGGCMTAGSLCPGGACTCCSALCLPYASGPTKVCQNDSGCHLTGDLCTKDADCCGASGTGLPGAGNVYCNVAAGAKVGVCHKASGCQPEGGLCKFTGITSACTNFRNDCCNAPGSRTAAVCKLDTQGIPRCYGLKDGACVAAGGNCADSADCCNGVACVPDSTGALKCGYMGMKCSPSGGPCTVAADCCDTGYSCITAAGSVQGICTPPMVPDGGSGGIDMGLCANYGQACTVGGTPCCSGIPCSEPGGMGTLCKAGESGCTCYMLIP